MKVKISKDQYEKCVKFAETRIDLSKDLYAYRGAAKIDKMIEDIIVGTVGEYAVAQYIRSLDMKCSRPDLKIYETRRKSFDADLYSEDFKIHVKSQSVMSSKRYGNSWLLQKSDNVIQNPGSKELFAFTEVNGREVNILGIVKCKDILKYDLLDECRVPWYRDTKYALYFKDMKDKLDKNKLWRLK